VGEEPKQERQAEAENEASNNREIERGVFAAMDDVAREAAETQGEFSAKVKQRADENEETAEEEERAAEFAEGIHERECRRNEVKM